MTNLDRIGVELATHEATIERGLSDNATNAERLAYHESRIERGLRLPRTRQLGTKRSDTRPHAVYICRDSEGVVLYVGISLSAFSRFAAHKQSSLWYKNVARIDLEHVPDRDAALKRELELIVLLSPVHNKAGVPA